MTNHCVKGKGEHVENLSNERGTQEAKKHEKALSQLTLSPLVLLRKQRTNQQPQSACRASPFFFLSRLMFKKSSKKRPSTLRSKDAHEAEAPDDNKEGAALLDAARQERDGNNKRHKVGASCSDAVSTASTASTASDPVVHQFTSDVTAGRVDKTFASLETETDSSRDTRSVLEANDDTGLYTGSANYKAIIPKSLDSIRSNKSTGFSGPLRANTTIRTTTRFDYQPDVCKDYKETGFCGFGDTCIFMHDRGGDPKASQLEDEWEKRKKAREDEQEKAMKTLLCQVTGEEEEVEEQADDLPFACYLCRNAFTDPQETTCGHYFCNKCVTTHYKKTPACPVCKKDLGGVFKRPDKLIKKKKRMKLSSWDEFKTECESKKEAGGGTEDE